MQKDATLVANNSQRCWMLHVASVCTPYCMLLHVVAVSLRVVGQSFKPVRLLSQLPYTAEQCWICLHSFSNIVGATHVYISNDLKWPLHADYIIKKENQRLYSLRILKQCGAPPVSLAKVFVTIVRPILEYAVSVWQNIPEFRASTIENIQKRAMRFIFPTHDYNEALYALSLTTLKERRVHLCQVYIARLQNENHPGLHFILPKLEEVHNNYHLRSGATYRLRPICKTKSHSRFYYF